MSEFTIVMIMFAPALAGIALVAALIIADIKHKQKDAYACNLFEKCIEKCGYQETISLIENANKAGLSSNAIILLMEHFCGIKAINTKGE